MFGLKTVRFSIAVSLIAAFVFPALVFGAALTSMTDVMTREQVSAASTHEIRFTTPTGVETSTDTVTLTFPVGFDLSTVTFADVDLFHGAVSGFETSETLAASPAAGVWGASVAGQVLTLTAPTDAAAGEIAATQKVIIRIGTNAAGGTNNVTNPGTAGTYVLSIAGTFGDTGSMTLLIVSGDSIVVSANVPDTSGGPGGGPGGTPDGTAPVISNIRVVNITETEADVLWDTDENADSRLQYGTTVAYENGMLTQAALVTSHSIHLSGLTPGTLYHFLVQSRDAVGNNAVSSDHTFTTAFPPQPPVISNIRVIVHSDTSATVLWDTDIPATSLVEYGTSVAYGSSASTPGSVTNHAVTLNGLTQDTLYHFRVISSAGPGLTSQSDDGIFRTFADTTPPANVFGFTATPGNAQVRLDWTNPTDPDFAYVRIVARTDRYPSGPTDGRFVYQGNGVSILDTGLVNGTRYFYANYAFDARDNRSSGAFAEATPTSTVVVPPPTPTSTEPIPPTPTTTPPVPPPTPTPTSTQPVPPPIPTPGGEVLRLSPTFYAVAGTFELQQDATGRIGGAPGRSIIVRVSTLGLGSLPERATVTVGAFTYALTPGPSGTLWSAAFIPGYAPGEVPVTVVMYFTNGARAVSEHTIVIQGLGRVFHDTLIGTSREPIQDAKVTLYDQAGRIWSAVQQPNPMLTASDGTYVFFVPNGFYSVIVSKDGFYEGSRSFQVLRNVASVDVGLREIPKNILDVIKPDAGFWENVGAVINQISNYLGALLQMIQTPRNQAVAKNVIAPTLLILAVLNTALAISALSLLSYLQYLVTQPFLLLGRRKRNKWGVVYNSLSKQPIDLAIVRLIHADTNLLVQTRITDAKGRFSFIVRAGRYRIEAVKPLYVFPTVYLKDQKIDVDFVDLYHGEVIAAEEGAVLTPNIPLDPIVPEELPRKIQFKKAMRKVQNVTGFLSVIIMIGVVIVSPTLLTGTLLLLQVAFYLLFRRLALPGRPKGWGMVLDSGTNKHMGRSVVRIFDKKFNKLLETQVTGTDGKYSFYVGKSVYYVTAEHPGYEKYVSTDLDLTKKTEAIIDTKIPLKKQEASSEESSAK